ncbi:hypothetical protein [Nostoc sp. TCL26-01]|uniref:hypothetical protein n=1 Tax=Nostoc sp. TCL26-01 TaxID=2576904 RepID=UPI0015BD8333|nr:hypothetical protein [Nostoc sp. TCL26-01]
MGTTTETVCPSESQIYCNASVIAENIAYWITNNCNCKSFYELFAIASSNTLIIKLIALPHSKSDAYGRLRLRTSQPLTSSNSELTSQRWRYRSPSSPQAIAKGGRLANVLLKTIKKAIPSISKAIAVRAASPLGEGGRSTIALPSLSKSDKPRPIIKVKIYDQMVAGDNADKY